MERTSSKTLDFNAILFLHLDRISLGIQGMLTEGEAAPFLETRIASLQLQVEHFETLLSPFLNKEYQEKIKKVKKYLAETKQRNVKPLDYASACQFWLKILMREAHNSGFLKVDRAVTETVEELENDETNTN